MSTYRSLWLAAFMFVAARLMGCAAAHPQPTGAGSSVPGTAQRSALASGINEHVQQPSSEPLPIGSDDPVWGSPLAPVTLVEFSDLECPFCSRVHPTVKSLQAKYGPNQLRVVFKHNPLPFHPHARPGAEIADAVLRQGGSQAFFAFLDLAFAEQDRLGPEALKDWVTRVGLDPTVVAKRAGLPDTNDKLERDIALASKVGALGTPAFRINGFSLSGAQPLEQFSEVIDAELSAAARLRSEGGAAERIYAARVAVNFRAPKPEPEDEPEEDLVVWKVPISGAPASGPADALVTIVEFFDYQCPYCRRAEATMSELLARYPKDVRVVLRQNPLPFHARAVPAANLALEARAQKGDAGFWLANRKLFEDKLQKLEEDDLLALGKELKLDPNRVKAAITKNTHGAEIAADVDLASDLKAFGTPQFFINGRRLSGSQPVENFVAVIEAQLEVARALVARGSSRSNVYAEIMKQAQEPEPPEQKLLPAPSSENPTRGPLHAPVVIHEFADFQCPFCSRVETTLSELEKVFPNQLRFVWHDYPLPFHDRARPASILAREARAQQGDRGFWKIHDLMFGSDGREHGLGADDLTRYAQQLHLDPKRAEAAQSDGRYDAVLAHDLEIAKAAGISGTPAFVINGYYISGAQPLSAFKRIVRYALAHPAPKAAPTQALPSKP